MDITTSNFNNKPTSFLQELDLRHHLHPFTDHKELKIKKPKVVVRANGVYLFLIMMEKNIWMLCLVYGV